MNRVTRVNVFYPKLIILTNTAIAATVARTTLNKQKMTCILIYFAGFSGNKRISGSYNKNAAWI